MIFAQADTSSVFFFRAIGAGCVLFVSIGLGVVSAMTCRRCSSDKPLVINGRTSQNRGPRVIRGGAVFVVPLLQKYAYLPLDLIAFEVERLLDAVESKLSEIGPVLSGADIREIKDSLQAIQR